MPSALARLGVGLRTDLTFASRTLLRTRGFLVSALSLGLALGATTAVYGTAQWLLNRSPRDVVDPSRVVGMHLTERGRGNSQTVRFGFSFPQFLALSRTQDAFTDVAAFSKVSRLAMHDGRVEPVITQFVTGAYFPLLGARPQLGRLLSASDDEDGAAALAVLSDAYWRSRFGADPNVIGTTFEIVTDPVRIIGVLPPTFEDYSLDWNGPTDVWLPMRSAQTLTGMPGMLTMTQTFFPIMGRLAPGVTMAMAEERARSWLPALPEVSSSVFDLNTIRLTPERELRISHRDEARSFLGTLTAVCLLVMLAAASNVANFLIGRASGRRREWALRTALGASRRRIAQHVITEAAVTAGVTSVVAVAASVGTARLLAPLPAMYLGLFSQRASLTTLQAVDGRMVGATAAIAVLAALVLSVPSLGVARDPGRSIKGLRHVGRKWGVSGRVSPRHGLLVLQVGLGVTLSISALLLARSMWQVAAIEPEFASPESLLLARLETYGMTGEESTAFFDALDGRLRAESGVVATTVSYLPPFAGAWAGVRLTDDDGPLTEVGASTGGAGYFTTNGIDVVQGDDFSGDELGDQIIINERLAQRLWPWEPAIGRTLVLNEGTVTVKGVVRRDRCRSVTGGPDECVWTAVRDGPRIRTIRLRTKGPAEDFLPSLQRLIQSIDSRVAVSDAQSMASHLSTFTRAPRFAATASALLALFGVALVGAGIATVFLDRVRTRTRELAVRAALGAPPRRLVAGVFMEAAVILGAGMLVGGAVATRIGLRLAGQLVGISPTDPVSFAVGSVLVLTVGLIAVTEAARAATTASATSCARLADD